MLIGTDIRRQLEPSLWFAAAGLEADSWQAKAMDSTSRRQLWCCSRQAGKSTCAGLLALAHAQQPDSLALIISPSQRQSAELLRKITDLRQRVEGLPKPIVETMHRLEFPHGGRILSLPSSESTVRGYSRVGLLILDEASRIEDDIVAATRPMMAVADGSLVCLSTPNGRQGFFFEAWEHGGPTWERYSVPASACPRISKEFLAEERANLGDIAYRQEYECEFLDSTMSVFSTAIIDKCFTDDPRARPLWQ